MNESEPPRPSTTLHPRHLRYGDFVTSNGHTYLVVKTTEPVAFWNAPKVQLEPVTIDAPLERGHWYRSSHFSWLRYAPHLVPFV